MPSGPRQQARRLVTAAGLFALLGWSLCVGVSYGSLRSAITNSPATAGSGTLLFTHTYAGGTTCTSVPSSGPIPVTSSFSCAAGIQPTSATPSSGTVSATDAIQDRGSALASAVTVRVSGASCAPVQLANAADSANPMMARYGTAFSASSGPMSGSGAITLDGANPGGYESAVLSQAQPDPGLSLGSTYGLGVWFKTTSTAGGPLFGIGTSPVNASGGNDRILYMTANGRLSFVQNTSGATTTTTKSYNDGTWHFAYVTMSAATVLLNLTSTTTIYVDGDTPVTGGGTLVGYSADTGYWHLGWSPVSGLPSYFTGSLSNFVVFDTAGAPSAPTATQRASQSAFTAWASAATERWLANDTGTATFGGPYPVIGSANPCTMINVSWGFTNPTSCGWSPNSQSAACTAPPASSLAAFGAAGAQTIASPSPGATTTGTLTVSRGATYNAGFLPGLLLYAPLTMQATAGGWTNTFSWAGSGSAFLG
jgi:hypothetical protein